MIIVYTFAYQFIPAAIVVFEDGYFFSFAVPQETGITECIMDVEPGADHSHYRKEENI